MPPGKPCHDGRPCSLVTLGCKVNQYETQAIRERFEAAGWRIVPFGEPAEATVVNSCAVTARAARKCRRRAYRAARLNPNGKLVVTGCLVEAGREELRDLPETAILVPKRLAARIPEILRTGTVPRADGSVFDLAISRFDGHTRAFLKVQDGCDAFCSYCIVPHVRGRVTSRPLPEAVAEARRLVDAGFREIVLTGIHLGSYGHDLSAAVELADVVAAVLAIEELPRLRLSSIEPNEVDDRLLGLLRENDRLAPQLHIPLQSGDDAVLRAMNRQYAAADYLDTVARIREAIPGISLTSDVLVGFPGETEAQFRNTLDACRRAGFSRIHVFSFSPRPGTKAATMPNPVPAGVIRRRAHQAEAVATELALAFKEEFVGRTVHPLVEERRDQSGLLRGYTEHYLRTLIDGPDNLMGEIVPVQVTSAEAEALRGRLRDHATRDA